MQYYSESFESRWPMDMGHVYQTSAKLDGCIQRLPQPRSTNSIPSQPQPVASCNKLKIYQWNVDGICQKFPGLGDLLINSDIDFLTVQESKLQKVDKTTPFVEGYATVRKDHDNISGGWLLLFIRTDIVFQKFHSFEKAGIEILFIPLRTTKSTWLKLYYSAKLFSSFTHQAITPSIILGNFNEHYQLWNPLQPPDSSGDVILDWILDISFCDSNCSTKTSWKVAEPTGSSDHLPIVIEINHNIRYQPVILRSARWQYNGPASQKKFSQKWEILQRTELNFIYHLLQQHSDICSDYSRWEIKSKQEIRTLDDFTHVS